MQLSVVQGLCLPSSSVKHEMPFSQVVASIHQPNSQITECFDDLLLLTGGRTAYFGPWQGSMPYFASVGFACPVYTNPSDHYLLTLKEAGDLMTKIWADSAVAKANLAEGYQSSSCSPGWYPKVLLQQHRNCVCKLGPARELHSTPGVSSAARKVLFILEF